jgi:probable rRNA maturation factor
MVREKSQDSKLPLKKELAKILIHGILHTLGYDHEISEKDAVLMEEKEAMYFKKISKMSHNQR